MFAILVRFAIDPEAREGALQAMREVAPLMRAVPGAIHFNVLDDDDDPTRPSFYELWTDRAAWQAHMANRPPAVARLAGAIAATFTGPPNLTTFQVVA